MQRQNSVDDECWESWLSTRRGWRTYGAELWHVTIQAHLTLEYSSRQNFVIMVAILVFKLRRRARSLISADTGSPLTLLDLLGVMY